MQLHLGVYALGALLADEIGRVEAHLARCAPCLTEAEQLTTIAASLTCLAWMLEPTLTDLGPPGRRHGRH